MSTALREQTYGPVQGLPDTRGRDWFDWVCAAVIVAVVSPVAAFAMGWLS